MAAELVSVVSKRCIIVLDAYFAVGPVFLILKQTLDGRGKRLIHMVTRAKKNVVAYHDPPPKTGLPGRPREYGSKLCLMDLFETMAEDCPLVIDRYRHIKKRLEEATITPSRLTLATIGEAA